MRKDRRHGRLAVMAVLCAGLLVAAAPARAGELAGFLAASAEADTAFRSALFYLRTGNPGVAALELGEAQRRWQRVVDHFADAPPDAFAAEPAWSQTLETVAAAVAKALAQANAGDAEAARATLRPVRATLSDMRGRNHVATYSDCVLDLNTAMDKLFVYRRDTPDLSDLTVANEVKARAAVYAYLLERCRAAAPAALGASKEFHRLYDGAKASVALVPVQVDRGDTRILINVLRELRSFDRMIFLRYG